jgi:hypothetical protein
MADALQSAPESISDVANETSDIIKGTSDIAKETSDMVKEMMAYLDTTPLGDKKPSLVRVLLAQALDFAKKLFLYLPSSLILFGLIADAIQEEFRYSIASFVGIGAVILNSILGAVFRAITGTPITASQAGLGCSVPGFESLESVFAPQGIVLPAAVFAYFLTDFGINRPPSENLGTAMLFGGFIVVQAFVMYMSPCFGSYYWSSSLVTILMGLLVGGTSGVIGWAIVRAAAPQRLPTGNFVVSPQTDTPPSNPLGPGGTPQSSGIFGASSSAGTCSAPSDDDQMVCEAYKNGQLITP